MQVTPKQIDALIGRISVPESGMRRHLAERARQTATELLKAGDNPDLYEKLERRTDKGLIRALNRLADLVKRATTSHISSNTPVHITGPSRAEKIFIIRQPFIMEPNSKIDEGSKIKRLF